MGLVPIQLDWLKKKGSFNDMAVCISLIKRASVVITDIYHCTVTSYRENIPTICVGNGSSVPHNTLSDNKKEIFHYQHFINDRYRYVENIQKNFEAEKKQSIEKISNKNAQHIINEHLCSHIKKTKDILINGINV